jgi:hypothetical protein
VDQRRGGCARERHRQAQGDAGALKCQT